MSDRLVLEADRRAPQRARTWMAAQVSLDPIRQAEAALLLSDLVTLVVAPSDSLGGSAVVVSMQRGPTGVVFSVKGSKGPVVDDLMERLLDQVARRWGSEEDTDGRVVWFEVRRPGTVEPALSALSTDELLARAPRDPDARDEVVRRFTPLALSQARRYRGKGISDGDLEQVALLGMLRALERYDPEVGAFDPFASRTISGELKRHFRDRAWSVRVPRALQERVLDVTRVGQELSQRLGRVPTPAEIAADLDITTEEVLEAMGASRAYSSISLEAPDEETGWTVGDALGVEDIELALTDRRQGLAPAMAALPDRERHILYLRFVEDMTQTEIADVVGISQMHVSRLLARALDRLRATVE
jgi:RNA polymerase sigma-B factor